MMTARRSLTWLLFMVAIPAMSQGLSPGKTVWNRDIYRLVRADGTSFGIKALAALKVVKIETAPNGEPQVWFDVEGKGQARVSDTDLARIHDKRASGKLPDGWSWVYDVDPHTLHPEWDEKFWNAIVARTLIHDMTPDMVRMAFGEPDRINVIKRPDSASEMWLYSTGNIWFVDGKLFTWQAGP